LLEADDLVGAYGHHWLGVSRPVVPPPEGVKSDLEITQALAARMGLADVVAGTAREWKERIALPKLAPAGVTLETLEAGAVRNPLAPRVLFADGKFATPSGKVNLMTARDVPPPDAPFDPEFPLLLTSLSTDKSQSSVFSKRQSGPAIVTVHPDSARGIADGATARLESAMGALTVRVAYDPKQRRDVLLIPKGGGLRDGRCANALIRARTTDRGEGGSLYDERVRLVPITD
jgi:anaerobic selenocysteine-containing dehydrogenase